MLESYIPNTEAVTDEQVSLFLKLLFHQDSTRQRMEKYLPETAILKGKTKAVNGHNHFQSRRP